jgi:hypothetical protein
MSREDESDCWKMRLLCMWRSKASTNTAEFTQSTVFEKPITAKGLTVEEIAVFEDVSHDTIMRHFA